MLSPAPVLQAPQNVQQALLHLAIPKTLVDYVAICIFSVIGATLLSQGILWVRPDPYDKVLFERPQLKNGAADGAAIRKETRDIARKLEGSEKDIVIFWGSQSGTSEGFAHRLGRELHSRLGQEALTADLSDFDPESIALIPRSKLAIFLLSTYGEGDPSDNTTEFWDWITKAKETPLAGLRYAAFGLGNSNYKFYNRVVDVVVDALDKLGASALMPVGRANDAEGSTAEDFMEWKNKFFQVLIEKLGMTEREASYMPTLLAEPDESLEPIDLHHGEPASGSPARSLPISRVYELHGPSSRHCLHVDVDLSDHPRLTYKTGDHLAVWPGNSDSEVDILFQALDLSHRKHIPINIKALDSTVKVPVPTPTSYEALFRYYLEIAAPLNRDSMLGLAQFAPSPEAKHFLLSLGKSKDAYADFLNQNHVTLGRILQIACPSQKWTAIPLSFIVEMLPQLQPRYYSISSSSVVSPRTPSITVGVSQTPLPRKPEQTIDGVASNYLFALSGRLNPTQERSQSPTYLLDGPNNALEGGKIFAHIRKSKFKLPAASSCPLIMVAAGTGLAPFRGFITERCRLLQIGKPIGEMILFFGCRHPDKDFIYQTELEEMAHTFGGKLRIVTAFSRVPTQPRVYVQDRIRESGIDVVRLLDDDASFYICGRAAMARDVEKAVEEILKVNKGLADEVLGEWTKTAKRQRKWQEDVWG